MWSPHQAVDLVGARLPDDRLRWAFRLYDVDNSGDIGLDEMIMVMEVTRIEVKKNQFKNDSTLNY